MTTADDLPLPRRLLTAIAGFAVLVLLVVLLYTIFQVETHRSADAALRRTAQRALPTLRLPSAGFATEPSFFRQYQRFVYETRAALLGKTARVIPSNQSVQVLIINTRSAPPQSVLLSLPGRTAVPLPSAAVSLAFQGGKANFTTVTVGGRSLRAYLVPYGPPSILSGQQINAVLEVLQRG